MVSIKRAAIWNLLLFSLSGCQLGYIAESSYQQAKLMRQRVPLQYALENYELTDNQRTKIKMAQDVRQFMKDSLGLRTDKNYSRYVQLDRPYVSYAVSASEKTQLKTYQWSFPLIGKVPYKAYFDPLKAENEAKQLQANGLDTLVRGVTAYSTLGWFEDPLLSSMLNGPEHRFVNVLIHETIHANLYIKSQSQFNERVASYLGMLGTETYYRSLGRQSELEQIIEKENHDEKLFSQFITQQVKELRQWYFQQTDPSETLRLREERFQSIRDKFKKEIVPHLKTKAYLAFPDRPMNNATLLLYSLYMSDFKEFEIIANANGRDFKKVYSILKSLEKEPHPQKALSLLSAQVTKPTPSSPEASKVHGDN